jgi:hypothetical protein
LKLLVLSANCRVKGLRSVLDQLTIHVQGLETLGVNAQQYGSQLTPIVMSKLPSDIRLTVARKKAEVEGREASILLKTNEHSHDNSKYEDKPQPGGGHPRSQGLSAARVLPRPWDTPNRNCKKTCTNF